MQISERPSAIGLASPSAAVKANRPADAGRRQSAPTCASSGEPTSGSRGPMRSASRTRGNEELKEADGAEDEPDVRAASPAGSAGEAGVDSVGAPAARWCCRTGASLASVVRETRDTGHPRRGRHAVRPDAAPAPPPEWPGSPGAGCQAPSAPWRSALPPTAPPSRRCPPDGETRIRPRRTSSHTPPIEQRAVHGVGRRPRPTDQRDSSETCRRGRRCAIISLTFSRSPSSCRWR